MSNKRITDLTELTNPTSDDVFPVVDIASNTTTKVQLGNLPVQTAVTTALATKENTITPGTTAQYFRGDKSFQTLDKTAVGLANVDNTSDANKPVSTAQQTALNAKQDSLVSGTNIKTVNSTSVLGSGNIAVQPTLVSGTSIKTVNSNSLLGSGDVAVQPTLVSGVSIKTVNSTSLLGSGDIPIPIVTPSGVSGAIQFSNGSAFASDAANLFWDDTNNRLGIGTNVPTGIVQIKTTQANTNGSIIFTNNNASTIASITDTGSALTTLQFRASNFGFVDGSGVLIGGGYGDTPTARLQIKGSGSTSATTSLLVQNSSGTAAMTVRDDLSSAIYARTQFCLGFDATPNNNGALRVLVASNAKCYLDGFSEGSSKATNYPIIIGARVNNAGGALADSTTAENGSQVFFGSDIVTASAQMGVNSTTRGFLPPRMTTTQKNAIASPAAGLVVYDSTTNKLQCYNGSTWNDLF